MSDISIIICTRNRADSLEDTLTSISSCKLPVELSAEILVVDNASRDRTAYVARRTRIGRFVCRYVLEPRAGKGYAYNTALSEAAGKVFLFTDDDLRVQSNWIEGMALPLLDGECDAIQGGVKMAPNLRRSWMSDYHRACLADTDRPMISPELIGANMAFHRRILDRVGGFDVNLGPGALGFGDDSLLAKQILKAGFKLKMQLDIVAEHHFEDSRLSRENWKSIAKRLGQSEGYVAHHWEHQDAGGCLEYAIRRFLWLTRNRLSRWREWHQHEGMPKWELEHLVEIHRSWWRWKNRNMARRYARHGLRLLSADRLSSEVRIGSSQGPQEGLQRVR